VIVFMWDGNFALCFISVIVLLNSGYKKRPKMFIELSREAIRSRCFIILHAFQRGEKFFFSDW